MGAREQLVLRSVTSVASVDSVVTLQAEKPWHRPRFLIKSAAYRRSGRGRGWQRAWWIEGDAATVRKRLQAELGDLAEWRPEGNDHLHVIVDKNISSK